MSKYFTNLILFNFIVAAELSGSTASTSPPSYPAPNAHAAARNSICGRGGSVACCASASAPDVLVALALHALLAGEC